MNKRIKARINEHLLKILIEVDRVCRKNKIKYCLIGGTLLGAVRHHGFIPWDDDIDIAMPREDFESFVRLFDSETGERFSLDYFTVNKKYWLPFAKVRLNGTIYQESGIKNEKIKNGFWIDIFPLDYTRNTRRSRLKYKKAFIKFVDSLLFNKNSKTIKNVSVLKKMPYIFLRLLPNKILVSVREKTMRSENKMKGDYYINYGSQYDVGRQTHAIKEVLPVRVVTFESKKFFAPKNTDYVLTNIYGSDYMQLPPKEKRITHSPKYIEFEDGEKVFVDE